MAVKERNGKIELLRFLFCMTIVLFHLDVAYFNHEYTFTDYISFFANGSIGVEFFFVVTGYLFAASCYRRRNIAEPIGKSTVQFVFHKWVAIFPYHILAFVLTYAGIVLVRQLDLKEALIRFLNGLPSFFLIQRTGIYGEAIIGVEWYISVMLLSLFLLYPLCKKNYDLFTRVIAPLAGIFLVGYLCKKYGQLSNSTGWDVIASRCQIRGIAEICLGAFAFEAGRFLNKLTLKRNARIGLTVLEAGCYLFAFGFACSTMDLQYEAYALYAIVAGVCITFSGQTYGNQFFQNRFVMFLGKLSLPIYLCQTVVRLLVHYYCADCRIRFQLLMILAGDIVLALFVYYAGSALSKKLKECWRK